MSNSRNDSGQAFFKRILALVVVGALGALIVIQMSSSDTPATLNDVHVLKEDVPPSGFPLFADLSTRKAHHRTDARRLFEDAILKERLLKAKEIARIAANATANRNLAHERVDAGHDENTKEHPKARALQKADDERSTGSLDKEDIRAAIKAALPEVKACFEEGLKSDPSLAGRIVLRLEIVAKDGIGIVKSGRVKEEETYSPAFENCVLQRVLDVEFAAPKGSGSVIVHYPFNFDPGGGFGGASPP